MARLFADKGMDVAILGHYYNKSGILIRTRAFQNSLQLSKVA